jgi:integrase
MSVTKRGKVYHLRIRPFGRELVTVRTSAQTKSEAVRIEHTVLTACRSMDYRALDPVSREVCIQMFRNRGLEIPADLDGGGPPSEELTLWKAVQIFVNYPGIKESRTRERYIQCLAHFVRKWGKTKPIKEIWVPQIRLFQAERQAERARPATVNREKGTLSKLFKVLMELRLVEANPCKLVEKLSEKSGERQAYLSHEDFEKILLHLPVWFRPIAEAAYYTGMRRGEIVGLKRKQVDLKKRMIYLGPTEVKEGAWKRVPIHMSLVPVFEDVMKVQAIGTDHVFLKKGRPVLRKSQLRWCWDRKVLKAGLDEVPRFHDLRHTWKTNARRSGMDPEIREAIMGHWFKTRAVSERYGRISEEELIKAIDSMTFEHGETEIWVAR